MPIPSGHREHAFTRWAVPFVILIIFAGFARTFYLRPLFRPPPIALLFQAHGALMTGWLLAFATQAVLIDHKRTDLHRTIGPFAAALAGLATIGGLAALYNLIVVNRSIEVFSAEFFKTFVAEDGVSLLLFAAFVTAGFIFRRRRQVHKLLMLMAAINLLPPAVLRLVSIIAQRLRLWDSLGLFPSPGGALALIISQHVALIVFAVMATILVAVVASCFMRRLPTTPVAFWGSAVMVANYAATLFFRVQP